MKRIIIGCLWKRWRWVSFPALLSWFHKTFAVETCCLSWQESYKESAEIVNCLLLYFDIGENLVKRNTWCKRNCGLHSLFYKCLCMCSHALFTQIKFIMNRIVCTVKLLLTWGFLWLYIFTPSLLPCLYRSLFLLLSSFCINQNRTEL